MVYAVFYENRINRYSINALLGAIETVGLSEVKTFVVSSSEEAISLLNSFPEDGKTVLNFSFFTTQVWEVRKTLKNIKGNLNKKVIFTAGGPHPSGVPKDALKMGFDFVFEGEGELSFTSFLFHLLKGGEPDSFVPPKAGVNLNAFIPFSFKHRRFNPIEITRGCPFGCSFCQTPRIFGRKVRHRNVDAVVSLVERMVSFGLKDIRFVTPNALSYGSLDGVKVNLKEVEKLLSSVRKVKGVRKVFFGSFPSEVRPEHFTEEAAELIRAYADNDNVVIGAQSGSDRILKLCRRQHTVNDVYRAVEVAVKYGFTPKVDFIFGFPDETEEDIKETIGFMRELVKMGAVIHAHSFMPLPKTPFALKKPRKVDGKILKLLNSLLGKGLVFGNWREQERLGAKIYNYLKEVCLDQM